VQSKKQGQPKQWSVIESIANIVVGFGIAFGATALIFPLFGFHVTLGDNFWITLIFTLISFFRSYLLRRVFNYVQIARSDPRQSGNREGYPS
jgi:membrane protein implicated in regulation of membrane protease activity